jgi:protein-tyrosine-phosphatase
MAEAIARVGARARGLASVTFASAGTSAWEDAPASDGALLVGIERQLDLNGHRARPLTPALVAEADLVLGMGEHHVERATVLGGEGKTFLLTSYASSGADTHTVEDPFGGDLDRYRSTAAELERLVGRVLDRIGDTTHGGPG